MLNSSVTHMLSVVCCVVERNYGKTQHECIHSVCLDGCQWPDALQNGIWHSSDMGDVTFNSTHFVSTMIVDFGSLTFECVQRRDNRYYSE